MGTKRSAADHANESNRPRQQSSKRTKLTPTIEKADDSSIPSSCSVSEDSALQSSPSASEHTRQSSLSSIQSPVSDGDSASSLADSESTTDSDASDSEDETIVTIGGLKKPRMAQKDITDGAQDLRTRLDALLPRIAASNEMLSSNGGSMNIEDIEDGEQHIEMNLGLGVLEEKCDGESESGIEDSEEEVAEDEEPSDDDVLLSSEAVQRPPDHPRADAMRKLLGRPRQRQRPGIEDMG